MKSGGEDISDLEHQIARLQNQLTALKKSKEPQIPGGAERIDSNQILESFFAASVTPLVLLDKDYNFIRVNAAYAMACQRDISEFPGHNHFEFYPSDAKEIFDRVVQTKKPKWVIAHPFTFLDHPKWGVTYWDWKLTPLLDDNGEVEFLVFSLEDVTERKKSELALLESESKYRLLFNNMRSGFVLFDIILDAEGKAVDAIFLDVNPAWEKDMGHSKDEVFGKKLREIFPWIENDWFKVYDEVIKSGGSRHVERHHKAIGKVLDVFYYSPQPGRLVVNSIDITERAKAEEATRKAAAEIEDLYNNAPCGYHSLDKDGVFIRMNATELSWLGYSREEVVGKMTLPQILTLESLSTYEKVFPKFKEQGWIRDLNLDFIRKDGSILPALINATVAHDSKGNYDRSRSTVFDVTDIRRTQEILQQSEERFRTAFENASIGKALTAVDGRFLKVNKALYRMLGYEMGELASAEFSSISHPDDIAISMEILQSLANGENQSCQFEKRYIHKDGHIVYVSINTIMVRDTENNPLYMITDIIDITEQHNNAKNIDRLNRVYSVLSGINEVIVRTKNINDLFSEACRIAVESGKLRMAWIGVVDDRRENVIPVASSGFVDGYLDTVKITLDPASRGQGPTGTCVREKKYVTCDDFKTDPRMEPWRDEALKRGYRSSIAIPLHRENTIVGSLALYSGEPDFFKEEEIRLLLSLADDISFAIEFLEQERLRKEAENEVLRLNVELEQRVIERTSQLESANEQMEAFIYSVSHDLRAPLRAIDGFSQIVSDEYRDKLDDEGRRYLATIRRNTQFMGELINGLLDLSRVGRATLKPSLIDMGDMAKQVYNDLSDVYGQRKISFETRPCMAAWVDSVLIHLVLQNLISNAIKFTKPKADARIVFDCIENKKENIYFIKDNGVGFDMQHINKLFGVFRRLHSSEEFEGTGIGLALVKRIINMHGGRVWAEGKINEGATFYFTLPK